MSESAAAAHVGDVLSALNQLWNAGGGISTSTSAVDSALSFSATAQQVTYAPPAFLAPALQTTNPGSAPSVSAAPSSVEVEAFTPRSISATLTTGSATAPTLGEVTVPDAPATAPLPAVPAAPDLGTLTVATAPTITVAVQDAPDIPALPELPALSAGALLTQTLGDLVLPPLDTSDIEAALARLRNTPRSASIPRYSHVIPTLFDAAGGLVEGDLVIEVEGIFQQTVARDHAARLTHDRLLTNLWASRGLDAGEGPTAQYNTLMASRFAAQRARSDGSARVRWTHDMMRAAYDVGTAAHTMAMDIELGLYDLEFAALVATAEAQLELVKALIAQFNADVALVEGSAVRYAGELEEARAAAARYVAEAGLVEAVGDLNRATADAFSAGERAKATEADVYRARLAANDAAIKGLRGRNQALATQAEAAAVELEAYKARVLSWTGDVERAKAEYSVYSARSRGTVAQNRAAALTAQLSGVRNEAVAAQAQKAAAEASASAARAVATATGEGARHTATELKNTVESIKARLGTGGYQRAVMQWMAETDAKAGALEGWATAGAAAVRFSTSAAEAAGRAAQISQDVATKIARAHATALEAAGRAKASIEAGRYAGFRANATLSASGGFGETIGRGTETSNSSSTETSYIDRYLL